MRKLNEKCGVFGIHGENLDVSRLTVSALSALQHRGQEYSGIAVSNHGSIKDFKGQGLVSTVYNEWVIQALRGNIAIGHNRYSTSKGSGMHLAQPVIVSTPGPDRREQIEFALTHNGNLPSVVALQNFFRDRQIDVGGYSDSQLMAHAIHWYIKKGRTPFDAIQEAYPLFTGAFSVVAMTRTALFAFRDQCGIRPLVMGRLNGATVFASETCALSFIGAEFVRDIEPGELVMVDQHDTVSVQVAPSTPKLDIFEMVYFAWPGSVIYGKSVYSVRQNCGRILARDNPMDVDLVVPVPETSMPAAIGYSRESGVPLELALVKNRYMGRTFIEPEQHIRALGVKRKLMPLPDLLQGKRIAVIDDSIVRGTTSKQLVRALRDAGAKEVHMMVCSPPVKYPDYYGIDIPNKNDLIAARLSEDEIRQFIEADSLHYLSLAGLIEATGMPEDMFSTSCFTGVYPIDLHERAAP